MAMAIDTRDTADRAAPQAPRRPAVMGYLAAGAAALGMWAGLLLMVL